MLFVWSRFGSERIRQVLPPQCFWTFWQSGRCLGSETKPRGTAANLSPSPSLLPAVTRVRYCSSSRGPTLPIYGWSLFRTSVLFGLQYFFKRQTLTLKIRFYVTFPLSSSSRKLKIWEHASACQCSEGQGKNTFVQTSSSHSLPAAGFPSPDPPCQQATPPLCAAALLSADSTLLSPPTAVNSWWSHISPYTGFWPSWVRTNYTQLYLKTGLRDKNHRFYRRKKYHIVTMLSSTERCLQLLNKRVTMTKALLSLYSAVPTQGRRVRKK